jgi:hypothetical protein
MTRVPTAIFLFAIVVSAAIPATAGDLSSTIKKHFQNRLLSEALSPDGRFQREPGVDHDLLRTYFHQTASADSTRGGFLSARFERLYGIERYQVSPMQVVFEHAEMAASMALFASAIGTTVGAWDEATSLCLIGAAAAAGALWGGTRADEPGLRIRYRWEP